MPFGKLQAGCHVPLTEEWLPSGYPTIKAWVLQRWLSFWKVLPSPQRNSWALSEWPLVSWSSWLLILAGRPALGRVLVVPHLKDFKNDGDHCVLGDLQCYRNVLVAFPRSVPRYNPVSELYGQFLHGFVFALTWTVNCGTLYKQVCAFPNHIQSSKFIHRWSPIKL